ncbi:hypothetical protein STVIR_5730 [Streptomyces viridochromogenes Tue57]|uniref:Uncharacterized protein n=1 Tax=Streptomyces viridochromogenes Tue57 TaxID=1160705 RepID=L8P6U1_STRVR|nr:hypothetical protein STVIR_5730 [Streptomyces viridochromogenes Tue57]
MSVLLSVRGCRPPSRRVRRGVSRALPARRGRARRFTGL